MINREDRVLSLALNALEDNFPAPRYATEMAYHECGVIHDLPDMLTIATGITACSELHYALNRIEWWTLRAMLADRRRQTDFAAECRAKADKWQAYFDNEDRQERAQDEDDARCAHAEAMDAMRYEENYR